MAEEQSTTEASEESTEPVLTKRQQTVLEEAETFKHNVNIRLHSLDAFLRLTQPIHSIHQALSNNLYGVNSLNTKPILPMNRDHQGFTFFTRPQLCLSEANCRNDRNFVSMLTSDDNNNSIHNYSRCMLDPRFGSRDNRLFLNYTDSYGKDFYEPLSSLPDYFDKCTAFIPPLTNNIISCTGWPDPVLPNYTSKANARGGQWIVGDGITKIYNTFDINCTFKNVRENPILLLMKYWTEYIANVFDGKFLPYPDYLASNTIDYNTRIYRIITDESKRYVKMIGACGASFPTSPDMGKYFNFNDGNPYSDQTSEISINFKCVGAMYNDPILIDEFNKTVLMFNPNMSGLRAYKMHLSGSLPDTIAKVPQSILHLFNYRAYPFIDYETLELEWYVDTTTTDYRENMSLLQSKKEIPKKKLPETKEKEGEGSSTDNPEASKES